MVNVSGMVNKYEMARVVGKATLNKLPLCPESSICPRNLGKRDCGKLASVPFCLQPNSPYGIIGVIEEIAQIII